MFLDYLKKDLEDHLKNVAKVRLIRTTKREGLVRARLLGASQAKGCCIFIFCYLYCSTSMG